MYFLILIISTMNLLSQIHIEKSDLELTHFQINDMIEINNYLFLVTQFENNVALEKLDLNNNSMSNDILKESGIKISAQATLFKSIDNHLWVGDAGKLLKLNPENNKFTNNFKLDDMKDSTSYRITSITEDEFGNKYCLMWLSKTLYTTNSNGTKFSYQIWNFELYKLENEKLKLIYEIENEGFLDCKLYYSKGILYFSTWGAYGCNIYTYDIELQKIQKNELEKPILKELKEWERIEEYKVLEFFQFDGEIYSIFEINAGNKYIKAFAKIDFPKNELEYFTLDRNDEQDLMASIQSYYKNEDKIYCSTDYHYDKSKKFFVFENESFVPMEFEPINPIRLITNNERYQSLKEYNRLDFLSIYSRIDQGMYIHKNGTLYVCTNNGLLKIDNFLEPTSSVEMQEIIIKTIPELVNVKNELYIESEFNINSYKVFDINSKMLQTQSNLNSNNINLSLEGLTIGIYFIEIETQSGSKLLKFIKN